MKLNYYADTDSLYIDLSSTTSSDSKEIADGLVVDFDDAPHIGAAATQARHLAPTAHLRQRF